MKPETIEKIFNFLEENEGKEIPESLLNSIKQLKFIEELEKHPDGIQYKHNGNLELINAPITKLPNDLYVGDSLVLINCKQFKKLPDNLYVGRSLNLYYCKQITKLPDNLYVGITLSIDNTSISELPNNLYVGLNLYIGNTPLADNYTDEQIYEMIKLRGGEVVGKIFRY